MDNEEFSPVIDKRKKKSNKSEQISSADPLQKHEDSIAETVTPVANDPQVQVNDSASAHAQTISSEQPSQADNATKSRNKVKEKHGFKPFAFFAGIFDIVLAVAIVGLGIWTCMTIFNSVDTGVTEELDHLLGMFYLPLLILIFAITAIAGILFLISGIFSLVASFKSDRRNLNGLLVAAIIFDAILLVLSILLLASSSANSNTLNAVLVVVLSVGLVFKILDIVLTKRRLKKYQTAKQEEYKETYHGPNFDNLNSVKEKPTETSKKDDQNTSDGVDFSKLGK